jgi:GNAT superfamily N-acetyltransferase
MSPAPGASRVRPARPADIPRIYELMCGLADYERLLDEVTGTVEELDDALFGATPAAECLVLEQEGTLAGYALFLPVFSSFRTRRRMWLEDLYVDPAARAAGGGRLLMAALSRLCLDRGILGIGWIVLDWNDPAIGFYQRLGGREAATSDWLHYGLEEAGMRALAESPPA